MRTTLLPGLLILAAAAPALAAPPSIPAAKALPSVKAAAAAVAETPGERELRRVVEAVAGARRFGTTVEVTGHDATGAPGSATVVLAVDRRNEADVKSRVGVEVVSGEKKLAATLVALGDEAFVTLTVPDQAPLAYRLAPGAGANAAAPGTAPSGTMGAAAAPAADPLAGIMATFRARAQTAAKGNPADEVLREVRDRGTVVHLPPNVLKIVGKDEKEGTAKLYYDVATGLPQTVILSRPDRPSPVTVRFSAWRRDQDVDTRLPQPRTSYRDFGADAIGSVLGALQSVVPLDGGEADDTGSLVGVPGPRRPRTPRTPRAETPSTQVMGEGVGAMMKMFQNPEFQKSLRGASGAEGAVPSLPSPSSPSPASKAAMEQGMKGMQDMMKMFQDPEFQKRMQETQKALEEMGQRMRETAPEAAPAAGGR